MKLTLKQASAATGKSKPTLLRAIQNSKLSGTKDELTGAWMVDPAELHRVYPAISEGESRTDTKTHHAAELYERLLAEKDRQITSLSEQLEAANEERRTTLRQLTALLTDQRPKTAPDAIVTPPLAAAINGDDRQQAPAPANDSTAPKRRGWVRVLGWITG